MTRHTLLCVGGPVDGLFFTNQSAGFLVPVTPGQGFSMSLEDDPDLAKSLNFSTTRYVMQTFQTEKDGGIPEVIGFWVPEGQNTCQTLSMLAGHYGEFNQGKHAKKKKAG